MTAPTTTTATEKPPTPEEAAKARFETSAGSHTMTIAHEDGVYRHLRFRDPDGGWMYWFDVLTWPGSLTIKGDMGTWTFSRTEDMFDFFRGGAHRGSINPGYWGEKLRGGLVSGNRLCEEYDGDVYVAHVESAVAEFLEHGEGAEWPDDVVAELRETVQREALTDDYGNSPPANQHLAIDAATSFHFETVRRSLAPPAMARALGDGLSATYYRFSFYEPYDWSLCPPSSMFLWNCWAILHAVNAYDTHQAAQAEGEPPRA